MSKDSKFAIITITIISRSRSRSSISSRSSHSGAGAGTSTNGPPVRPPVTVAFRGGSWPLNFRLPQLRKQEAPVVALRVEFYDYFYCYNDSDGDTEASASVRTQFHSSPIRWLIQLTKQLTNNTNASGNARKQVVYGATPGQWWCLVQS